MHHSIPRTSHLISVSHCVDRRTSWSFSGQGEQEEDESGLPGERESVEERSRNVCQHQRRRSCCQRLRGKRATIDLLLFSAPPTLRDKFARSTWQFKEFWPSAQAASPVLCSSRDAWVYHTRPYFPELCVLLCRMWRRCVMMRSCRCCAARSGQQPPPPPPSCRYYYRERHKWSGRRNNNPPPPPHTRAHICTHSHTHTHLPCWHTCSSGGGLLMSTPPAHDADIGGGNAQNGNYFNHSKGNILLCNDKQGCSNCYPARPVCYYLEENTFTLQIPGFIGGVRWCCYFHRFCITNRHLFLLSSLLSCY